MEYINILTIVVAVIGWIIAHKFTSERELKNKQREIKVKYLIETYLKLENCIQRMQKEVGKDLEYVNANIQLFGSDEQIELTKEIANNIANNGSADLEGLLKSLRKDLREELELSDNNTNIQFLRMSTN